MPEPTAIAIVGMAAHFPGAPDLSSYWQNLRAGVDAIGEVPAGRWDPLYYAPDVAAADRFYCKRGGFLEGASFDALRFGVMPVAVEGAEPDQLLALQAAADALADAGYEPGGVPRERTSVILGRGGYLTPGMARLDQRVRTANQIVEVLRSVLPDVGEDELAEVKREFNARLGPFRPDTCIGLVPNLAASRVANRLDLHGSAYTVDAACASSLVAVDHAVRELGSGAADLVLAGGVHICHDVTFWSVFTQLGALSRAQQIRPFDRQADGLLIGEGVGVVALKRLRDAERDGDRIYAVIHGTGVASDGRGATLMSPAASGQLLALRRAWEGSDLEPSQIGLLEAHGTGTPAGDQTELTTLAQFFGRATGARAGLGSVKSMIGHTMPAAGVAGLIKAALAVHHGVLLPTLHCEQPHEGFGETRFRPVDATEPWEIAPELRVAAVNAFGFGGINAHVVLAAPPERTVNHAVFAGASPAIESALMLAGDSPAAVLEALDAYDGRSQPRTEGSCRLALVDPTEERLEKARKIVNRGKPWRGRQGIWFSCEGLIASGGKVVYLYPGVEGAFAARVRGISQHFGLPISEALLLADRAARMATRTADFDLEQRALGIIELGRLLTRALEHLRVAPDALAGHSIGEWTALITSETVPAESVDGFIDSLALGTLEVPGVAFAALGTSADRVRPIISSLPRVAISHDNCPHQVIICGPERDIDEALGRLREARVMGEKLPFKSGFHSPHLGPYLEPMREPTARVPLGPPSVPVWSATSCSPYPSDQGALRELLIDHLLQPVRFRRLVERLYEDGARVFVQLGTGSLPGFVRDTLRKKDHLVVSASARDKDGLDQLQRAALALWVEGAPVDLGRLPSAHRPPGKPSESRVRLDLGAPLVEVHTTLDRPAEAQAPPAPAVASGDPVMRQFEATLDAMRAAQSEVLQVLDRGGRPSPTVALEPRDSVRRHTISVTEYECLVDHTFYRQPEGWPNMSDRYPVVPMTMSLELMMDAARALVPELQVIGLERVRAYRWLAVSPALEVEISAHFDGQDRVTVRIKGYAEATVIMAQAFPAAPEAPEDRPLAAEREAPMTAREMYDKRWMFHGPAYQGVTRLGPIGADGIRGEITTGSALGALLDNAGQLFGYWVMLSTDVDSLAFPFRIKSMRFFAPHPMPGERLECDCRITHVGLREVRSDLVLTQRGRVWCEIEQWEDRRFDTDEIVWPVLRYPEQNLLGRVMVGGDDAYCLVEEHWRGAASRDLMARRYLGELERSMFDEVGPRGKRTWLLGRIAIKDAVRDFLWRHGHGPIFPVEIQVATRTMGRPIVSGPFRDDLRIGYAVRDDTAVAIVRQGRPIGVALERIEPVAGPTAERMRETLSSVGLADKSVDDFEWYARLRGANEAVARLSGTSREGVPRDLGVEAVEGSRFLIDGVWVETKRDGDLMVAWTC